MKKIKENIKTNKKSARKNYSNQKGITLIALVITIVVLLILAGVSINAIFSDNGIINKAKDAQNKMDQATQNDLDTIDGLSNWIDSKTNGNAGGGDTPTVPVEPTADTAPYYPDTTFTKVEGTDLSNGLVIKDAEGNEYVWIEVPKTTGVYPTAGLKITNFTEDEYTAIETDLHTYTDYYRRDKSGTLTSYKDEYYSDDVTGLTSAQYTELKQKMLKSIYENGGFWIGRYEAGITKNRTSKDEEITAAPLSKAGTVENAVYPYTYVTCSQAQTIASKLSTEKSYTSSLMFGVQWDLVLKHIETKEVEKGTALATIQSALRSNSSSWGNYNSSNVKQSGSSETYKKMNIYDLAGNVNEWTLEYTALTYGPCATRGGNYNGSGSSGPASDRSIYFATGSNDSLGFRSSLFK